jgi:hypothetical protein
VSLDLIKRNLGDLKEELEVVTQYFEKLIAVREGELPVVRMRPNPSSKRGAMLVEVYCDRCETRHHHGVGKDDKLPTERVAHCHSGLGYDSYMIVEAEQ